MKTRRTFFNTFSVVLGALLASAADWPQWRGPDRNGISQETGLLDQWPEGGPKLLWRVEDIGAGYSTPAVVGDRLYLLSSEGVDNEFLQAHSIKDGKKLWSTRLGKVGHPEQSPSYPGSRSTPTVDGDSIYVLGSDGDLVCVETATGKPRWNKNVRTDFGGKYGEWAYSESPLVDGEALICTPGGAEATLVALNKNTGEVIWKCAVPEGDEAAYASPIVTEVGGVKQYVQFLGGGVVGVEAKSGRLLWRYNRTAENSPANIPTPVARDGYVYTGASRSGGGLVKLTARQGEVTAEEVYFTPRLPTSIGGSVLLGDYLYGTTRQAVVCGEFVTGEVKWTERGLAPASLCYADGHLYLHGENGELALIEASPDGYREKGRFTPPGEPDRVGKTWTYPVISGGRLYLRDQNVLWCWDIRDANAAE